MFETLKFSILSIFKTFPLHLIIHQCTLVALVCNYNQHWQTAFSWFIRLCLFRTNLCDLNYKHRIVLRLQVFLTLIAEKSLPLEDAIDTFWIIQVLFKLSKSREVSRNVNNNDKWLKKKGFGQDMKNLSPWFWFGHLSQAESCREAERLSDSTCFHTKATRMDCPLMNK